MIYVLSTITFQLSQTSESKPKVLILADDPYAITVELGSLKTPAVYSAAHPASIPVVDEQRLSADQKDSPICQNHQIPMVWQKGRKGYFWSCHAKMLDGSWCSYRPA